MPLIRSPADALMRAPDGNLVILMERYVGGDESACTSLYRILAPHVRRQIRSSLGDDSLLEDLVQDTFIKAHVARFGFDTARLHGGSNGVVSWYCAIARNAAISELRRRTSGPRLLAQWSTVDPDLLTSEQLDVESLALTIEHHCRSRDAIHGTLARLPKSQRRVIELHKLCELSMREVAQQLGIRPGAARVRAHRAYRAMAEQLESYDEVA